MEQGLTNNIIHATLFDRENNIWVGTHGGGITVFLGDHIRSSTVEDGLPNNVITSITQDNLGEHWVTTYGGGIAHYEDQRFVTYNEYHGLVDNKVYTAELSDQNDLLIGDPLGTQHLQRHRLLQLRLKRVAFAQGACHSQLLPGRGVLAGHLRGRPAPLRRT
ncbi:MAG: two-component regulator propeller domain-containing protein [Balneolaceae bacterium]|nr:two-component regulator propeller domain-containing protein [Balneolaceae bacterium]